MKISDYINFNIVEPPDHQRWTDGVTSLDHFSTVAFDRALMRQMIEFGWYTVCDPKRPWVTSEFGLMLSPWIEVVPDCYHQQVVNIAVAVFNRVCKGEIYKRHHKDMFVEELRNALWNQMEPEPARPTRTLRRSSS